MPKKVPREFLQRIKNVTNKRARLVLDRIVEKGTINTEELSGLGYVHPPRARMDALDLGFPIEEHQHVAMQEMRRIDVVWQGEETRQFDRFRQACNDRKIEPRAAIKAWTNSGK